MKDRVAGGARRDRRAPPAGRARGGAGRPPVSVSPLPFVYMPPLRPPRMPPRGRAPRLPSPVRSLRSRILTRRRAVAPPGPGRWRGSGSQRRCCPGGSLVTSIRQAACSRRARAALALSLALSRCAGCRIMVVVLVTHARDGRVPRPEARDRRGTGRPEPETINVSRLFQSDNHVFMLASGAGGSRHVPPGPRL